MSLKTPDLKKPVGVWGGARCVCRLNTVGVCVLCVLVLLSIWKVCSRLLCTLCVEDKAQGSTNIRVGWAGTPTLPLRNAMTIGKWPIFSGPQFPHLQTRNKQTVLPHRLL